MNRGSNPSWKPQGFSNLVMENPDITKEIYKKPLPENYSLRVTNFSQTDIDQLAHTCDMAFGIQHGDWNVERVHKALIEDETVKKTFVIDYLNPENGRSCIIACGSARIQEGKYPDKGYPHWIAVHPDHQGQGLASVIMNTLHKDFCESYGLHKAILETQDPNIPAIAIYLKMGYTPVMVDATMEERWKTIFSKLH